MKASIIIRNIFKSGTQFVFSIIFFKMFPNYDVGRADLKYIQLDERIFLSVADSVNKRMIAEGITYKEFYVDDAFDCVEFADCWANYFVQEMVKLGMGIEGYGIPVRPMSYYDKKRGNHACIMVKIMGKYRYYEPYPEYFKRLSLDREEAASILPIGF